MASGERETCVCTGLCVLMSVGRVRFQFHYCMSSIFLKRVLNLMAVLAPIKDFPIDILSYFQDLIGHF